MRQRMAILTVVASAAVVLAGPQAFAQARPDQKIVMPAPSTAPQQSVQVVPGIEADATEKRERLEQVMRRYPPSLARILKTDPSLMQEPAYVARYPALAAFLAANPDVISNPAFYFDHVYIPGEFEPRDAQSVAMSAWRDMMQTASVITVMAFVAIVLAWLTRTVLNHRRWLRLSRVQDEVHNKLLDRFSGTGELLTYVQTTAGRRFLEAAPIDVEPSGRAVAAPINRMLWSMQAGVVLAVGGLGFQYASGSTLPEVAQGLSLIGTLAVAFGVGFLISGVLSYLISKRLGLLEPVVTTEPPSVSERSSA
jgi:hypothetical protein